MSFKFISYIWGSKIIKKQNHSLVLPEKSSMPSKSLVEFILSALHVKHTRPASSFFFYTRNYIHELDFAFYKKSMFSLLGH